MKKMMAIMAVTVAMLFTCFSMISATAQADDSTIEPEATSMDNGEERTGEEVSTEEGSRDTSTEGSTEEVSTEESSEETTTEEPTTLDYEIIEGVYKVKEGTLIEYLGDAGDETVTTITIPASIKIIDDSVFLDYKYIETVTFEAGSQLISIGQYAFKGCSAMTSITLPKGLQTIGYQAFDSCTALESLKIPATVTKGDMILGTVSGVKTVKFAAGMTAVPSKILKGASSVTKVTLKAGITTIGAKAFYNCSGLTTVDSLKKGVTTIQESAFYGCSALADFKIPSTIKTLENYAFKNCTSLKTLTLWRGIVDIRTDVFKGDTNLLLKVYANTSGKAYARQNNLNWEYTDSELKRQEKDQEIYNAFTNLISAKNATKYQYKYLANYVPQGVCVIKNYVAVSMYNPGLKTRSLVVLYDKSTGAFEKQIILPSKDHVGSLAKVKGRLVIGLNNISTTDYLAVINYAKLKKAKDGKVIAYNYKVKIPGHADFATFDGTFYWAGHSANISSPYMYGYKVKVKKKKLVFTKKYSFVVPSNTQGIVAIKGKNGKRTFLISQSYGRLPSSKLIRYKTNIKQSTILGNPTLTRMVPSMSEGIYRDNKGYLYITFESAASLYCGNPDYTSEVQMKNVGKIKYSDLSKLKSE